MSRRSIAALLRRLAAFIDSIEAPDTAQAHGLRVAAAVYRRRADAIDPQAPCIVCRAMVSGDHHACPPHALEAWAKRARALGYEA